MILHVCPDCFESSGLKRKIISIRKAASEGLCDFHERKKGVPIERVAEIVDPVFRGLYFGGPDDGNRWVEKSGGFLAEVLHDLTQADDDRAIDGLIDALVDSDQYWPSNGEEAFYDPEYFYELLPDDEGRRLHNWQQFRRSLMFETRFFNPDSERWLDEIFRGVQQLRDAHKQGPVYLIAPGTPDASFYRARVANSLDDATRIRASLAQELGPPPEQLRKAGRLNPAGISAFYGAFDLSTCIAELRPSVGGSVVSAQFTLARPICVLDTTRFADSPRAVNLFAAGAMERARQFKFMQTYMHEIAKPVFPGDEHLQYLPTQAVAEFLNKRFKVSFAGEIRGIDAVIFRSAQRPGGKNIVILGDAAIVGDTAEGEPSVRTISKDDPDDWFQQEWEEVRAHKPVGLVPDPATVRWTRINGAEFDTVDNDMDEDDFGIDD